MAVTGARKLGPACQVIATRGFLDPVSTAFELGPLDHFIEYSLTKGMTPDQSFYAAMNSRNSMVDKKLAVGKADF